MALFESVSDSRNIVLGCIAVLAAILVRQSRRRRGLPPSPKSLPIIGHTHLVPPARPWLWYDQLCREFESPLVYLNLAGQDVIVINEYQAAIDLLEKRSATYSSRPHLVVASEYASSNRRIVLTPYGDRYRRMRGVFHRQLTNNRALAYVPIQQAEARLMMRDILKAPKMFRPAMRRYAANVILKMTYGLDSEGGNKELIKEVDEVIDDFIHSLIPGAHLVDVFPILDHLPDFLAPWRARALRMRTQSSKLYLGLLNDLKTKIATGKVNPEMAFAARLTEEDTTFQGLDELALAFIAGTMFEAGTDTTACALHTFLLATITHPAAFKTAQDEVLRICGPHSPTFEDFERCEYMRAMCKESLRWRTIAAGGIPHMSTATEDDWYNGMRIPAGATMIPNHWGMCFDKKRYGQIYDTQLFEPRRWIERPEGVGLLDEDLPTFGFGRRICAGRLLAVNSIYFVVSHLLYNFDIKSKEGTTLDTFNYTSGFNIEPEAFECIITPLAGREKPIEREAEEAREALMAI